MFDLNNFKAATHIAQGSSNAFVATCGKLMADAAKEIERLSDELKTIAPLIFVVEDDHAIMYAGLDLEKAGDVICRRNSLSVWRSGVWLGDVTFEGVWLFKTKDCDIPDLDV